MIYTNKHLHLMCKNIKTKFFMFKTNDGKIHLANDVSFIGSKVFNLTNFITDIDEEHAKLYIVELFKNHGDIDESSHYTDMRNCCDCFTDLRTVVMNGKPIQMIADNDGFYGFKK